MQRLLRETQVRPDNGNSEPHQTAFRATGAADREVGPQASRRAELETLLNELIEVRNLLRGRGG